MRGCMFRARLVDLAFPAPGGWNGLAHEAHKETCLNVAEEFIRGGLLFRRERACVGGYDPRFPRDASFIPSRPERRKTRAHVLPPERTRSETRLTSVHYLSALHGLSDPAPSSGTSLLNLR